MKSFILLRLIVFVQSLGGGVGCVCDVVIDLDPQERKDDDSHVIYNLMTPPTPTTTVRGIQGV